MSHEWFMSHGHDRDYFTNLKEHYVTYEYSTSNILVPILLQLWWISQWYLPPNILLFFSMLISHLWCHMPHYIMFNELLFSSVKLTHINRSVIHLSLDLSYWVQSSAIAFLAQSICHLRISSMWKYQSNIPWKRTRTQSWSYSYAILVDSYRTST